MRGLNRVLVVEALEYILDAEIVTTFFDSGVLL
jgi:hypothetical protein